MNKERKGNILESIKHHILHCKTSTLFWMQTCRPSEALVPSLHLVSFQIFSFLPISFISVSTQCFGYPRVSGTPVPKCTQIPSDMCIPGRDAQNIDYCTVNGPAQVSSDIDLQIIIVKCCLPLNRKKPVGRTLQLMGHI